MSETEFLRIESRCGNAVAVFDRGYQSWVPTDAGSGYYDDGTFCLNEESLLARIDNLKRDGYDVSQEQIALAEMRRAAKDNHANAQR